MNKGYDVTQSVVDVLGNIVEYAYCSVSQLYCASNNPPAVEPNDGSPVFVKLTNGKMFKIWASEWGGITSLNEAEFIKGDKLQ